MKTEDFAKVAGKGVRGKTWFITYPQCPVPKEVVLKHLEKLGLKEYIICEEEHADGGPHLHAYIVLKNRSSWSKSMFDFKDLEKEWHGNYQKVYNVDKCREYVIKDGNYISNIDVEAPKKHKSKLTKEDYLKDPCDLLEEGKISFMQVANFLKNQDCYKMLLQRKTKLPEVFPEKKRHWWIWGNSNTGKTTYLRQMMREKDGGWFQIPTNNDWKGYNGEKNLYLDEYKGQLTLQELNRVCDGGAKVNTKGGTTQLAYDVIVWICSNYSIGGCYNKLEECMLECLYNRFQVKEMVYESKDFFHLRIVPN